jgi:pimeloyl-ACP methyl ester carboxylesterase
MLRTPWLSLSFLLLAACDSAAVDDAGLDASIPTTDAPVTDWPLMEAPASHTLEGGVVRDVVRLPTYEAPANPTTGDVTPSELNATQIARYHGSAPARAIVLAMPGFLGGAGSFDRLARELVASSIAAGDPIEVWAIDRRANLMEDLRGLDTAEASGNADVAKGYYRGADTVGGERFEGYRVQGDLGFMSEWGLVTHIEDVRSLIERIPEADRIEHVFLMGHSLGGSFAETFAAWRFEDGVRGSDLLAGVILIDGAQGETPSEEAAYLEGTSGGIMPSPGLETIRTTNRFVELPFLGVSVYTTAEILSLEALTAPDAVVNDAARNRTLSTLLGLGAGAIPDMTNEAALGWGFDSASNGLSFAAVSCGVAMGGPTEEYDGFLGGRLIHPSDPDATYSWIDASESDPAEFTPIESLAYSWTLGRTNFGEWYFPQRLPIDLAAVGGLAVADDGWQAALDLRAFDGALMDAPVLAIASGLRSVASFEASRARGAPLGAGRPNAGTARTDDLAYRIVDATFMTHIDPLTAPNTDANPVPGAILEFITANVGAGTTSAVLE